MPKGDGRGVHMRGRKLSEEHRENMKKGIVNFYKNGGKGGMTGKKGWNKGKPWPEDIRVKMSLAKKGRKLSEEVKKKMSEVQKNLPNNKGRFQKGHKNSEEQKRRHRESIMGAKNSSWKGGITPIHEKIRKSPEYKLWRTAVFERDNYTCIWCGVVGGKLNADHIKPFAYFPELRFAIDNGRTLCVPCHRKTDTWGWKAYNLYISNKKYE